MNGQSYANHRHQPRLWGFSFLTAVLGLLLVVALFVRQISVVTIALLALSISLVCAVLVARRFALKLQDRIIRLEMQVRLARLGLESSLARLTLAQIIALRFASDAELPALIERAVASNMSGEDIKKAVTSWQGDYLRT